MAKVQAAAIYCRISDDQTGRQAGVKRQKDDCIAHCESRGWPIHAVYVDNDISAYSGKRRPEYERMLSDIEAGSVDAVVVWHVDRLYRRVHQLETFLHSVQEAGIERNIKTLFGDYDLSNPDHKAMLRVAITFAEKESDDKSRRIKRKQEELARAGLGKGGGTRPFGFDEDRVTHRPDEADMIGEAARRVLAGESIRSVCADFCERGIPTVSGGLWKSNVLKRILVAPRTAGLRQHNGAVVAKAEWKPIINRRDHERLVAMLTDPKRQLYFPSKAHKYLLTGMAYCGFCGERMVARPKAGHIPCYTCASSRTGDFSGCGKTRRMAEPVDTLVRDAVFEALSSKGLTRAIKAATGEDKREQALVDELRLCDERREQVAADFAEGILTRDGFLAAERAIVVRADATRKKLASNGKARTLAALPGSTPEALMKAWEEKSVDWRRALVAAVVERVVVHPARRGYNRFDPTKIEVVWRA